LRLSGDEARGGIGGVSAFSRSPCTSRSRTSPSSSNCAPQPELPCPQSSPPPHRDATSMLAAGVDGEVLGRTPARTSRSTAARFRRRHPDSRGEQIFDVGAIRLRSLTLVFRDCRWNAATPVGTENLIRIDCVTESRDNVRQRTKAPTVSLRRTTIPAFHRKRSPFDV
jgi:hypothetical protein